MPSTDGKAEPLFPRTAAVSLNQDQLDWLNEEARRTETSKSWILRRGLELYRAQQGEGSADPA